MSLDELQTAIKKTSNWKSPGPDVVPNVWPKQLTALHQHLLNAYNQATENPENLPDWFPTTQTYLMPRTKTQRTPKTIDQLPANQHPTRCSRPKEATPISQRMIYYLKNREVVSRKNSYGCKDQLLINKMIIEDCKKKKKNLSMTWIDYRKAYDSVLQSWILQTLQMYRFNKKLIKFMETSTSNWKITIKLSYNDGCIITD